MADSKGSGTMFAYRFRPDFRHPIKEEIPVPELGPDEVLLEVLAAGVCHSDLGLLDTDNSLNHWANKVLRTPGFTMGHEGAGMLVSNS